MMSAQCGSLPYSDCRGGRGGKDDPIWGDLSASLKGQVVFTRTLNSSVLSGMRSKVIGVTETGSSDETYRPTDLQLPCD